MTNPIRCYLFCTSSITHILAVRVTLAERDCILHLYKATIEIIIAINIIEFIKKQPFWGCNVRNNAISTTGGATVFLHYRVVSISMFYSIYSVEKMAFYIQSVHSKKYLDIKDNNDCKGAEVIIFDFTGGKNQQWKHKNGNIVSELNGYVPITGIALVNFRSQTRTHNRILSVTL